MKNDKLKNSSTDETLEFPMAPDFVSSPPKIDPQAMLRRNKQPGEKERRLAEKISVEFVL
jgi:hypothetical protein